MRLWISILIVVVCISRPGSASWWFLDGRWVHDQELLFGTELAQAAVGAQQEWMEQRLDHFDPTNTRTWRQRYFTNISDEHDGPIFLQIGGEGTASPYWIQGGQVAQNVAPRYKAHQFVLEHRYYGESHPTPDLTTENLRFLSSEQALQDIARFIEFINEKHNFHTNKWIVFGGSYAGSLAAWFRLKYPHLAIGAVASSAPVQAVLDFQEYLKVVADDVGPQTPCASAIRNGFQEIEKLLQTDTGRKKIEKVMNLCAAIDPDNELDIMTLGQVIVGRFMVIAQYDGAAGRVMQQVCSNLTDSSNPKTPFERLAQIATGKGGDCTEFRYNVVMEEIFNTQFVTGQSVGVRSWIYQTCTEFGFFQTTDYPGLPFGHSAPLKYYFQICKDAFKGKDLNPNFISKSIDSTNAMYGGFNLTVTNVILPNGSRDPWHALGILQDLGPTTKAIIIQNASHCQDMYADGKYDWPALKEARTTIAKQIDRILSSTSNQ